MRDWTRRRWLAAIGASLATTLVVAIPTAMIPTPIFGREVAVTWWSWPVLVVTAVLSGLVFATYVREPGAAPATSDVDKPSRFGMAGGVLTFFAVGCPVCNKIVLVALGSSGAMNVFAPVQPLLAIASLIVMGVALRVRLSNTLSCRVS